MEHAFTMSMLEENTDVHITLSGYFSARDSRDFSNLMQNVNSTHEQVFFTIDDLYMYEADFQTFRQCYAHIPEQKIIFNEEQETTQGNSEHYEEDDCHCHGPCTECACKGHKKHETVD